MSVVDSPEGLGKAIRSGSNEIEISYNIKTTVVSLRAVGPVAWGVAAGAIVAAVIAILSTPSAAALTGGPGAAGTAGGAAAAFAVLSGIVGAATARFLVKVAVAARDPRAVSRLRKDYEPVDRSGRHYLRRIGK